jgi:DNA-directed RNA polymerase subunit RPC12/RpoP
MVNSKSDNKKKVTSSRLMTHCPHCGVKLSSWEQVLLNIDHALMCKNCWYRIILDVRELEEPDLRNSEESND